MAAITASMVNDLRQKTGVGMMECKKALTEADGDFDAAVKILREKCGIDSKTIRRLKANENIETKTIDKICLALDCAIEDVAEYVRE